MKQLQSSAASEKLANESNRDQRRLLKKKDLAAIIPCSTRQIELMVKAGKLPRPFYCGDSSPRWRAEDFDAWLERLATAAQASGVTQ